MRFKSNPFQSAGTARPGLYRISAASIIIAFCAAFCLMPPPALAHVDLTYPDKPETFYVGEAVDIKWDVYITHGPGTITLEYSTDDGASYTAIVEDIPFADSGDTTGSRTWIVPNAPTDQLRIRVSYEADGLSFQNGAYPGENDPQLSIVQEDSRTIILEDGVNGYEGVKDNTIYQGSGPGDDYEDNSNGSGDYIFTGNTANSDARRALLRFDLSPIPHGAELISATLELTVSKTISGDSPQAIHRLTRNWGEATTDAPGQEGTGGDAVSGDATWINAFHPGDAWANPGGQGDYAASASALATAGSEGSRVSWSSGQTVQDVKDWMSGSSDNHGWIAIGDESAATTAKRCYSSDNAGASAGAKPRLLVEYVAPRLDDPIPETIKKGDVTIELRPVMTGLVSPLGVVSPDDGSGRRFIYDQAGQVHVLSDDGATSGIFLDVSAELVALSAGYDERGLLGFAPAPDFAARGLVYAYYSVPDDPRSDFEPANPLGNYDHQSILAEWSVDPMNPGRVDPASKRVLMVIDQPQGNHNGGTIAFGADGMLYVALGDGGSADDQGAGHVDGGNGQDPTNIYGTIIRIDPFGDDSYNGEYGIPPDNPMIGQSGLDEIYAYGLRNPYRFSFDRGTTRCLAADAGQNDVEEANLIVPGGNYGWRYKEGSFFFDPNGGQNGFVRAAPLQDVPDDLIDPFAEYDHDEGRSAVGGNVYRAGDPALEGRYVFGDFGSGFGGPPSGRLFYADIETGEIRELKIDDADGQLGLWLKGFGEDDEGNLYVCGSKSLGPSGSTGEVLMIVNPRSEGEANGLTIY